MSSAATDNFESLCPGCFANKGEASVCPQCGYDESGFRSPLALSTRTLLHKQFLVGRVLGKPGGFGITYFGWDTKLQTTTAIKEYLPREFVSRGKDGTTVTPHTEEDSKTFQQGLEQFLEEARNLARFDHRNLVRVRHFFEENDTAYLVMDYLEGCNLDEYRKQKGGKLSEPEAIDITLQVLDGLQQVHEKGLLHRDIKPQNIYMTSDGRAILLDFGAARVAMGGMTRSLSVVLTPGFAPYEQYSRRGLQGPWTDIYACAATLHYLVTGKVLPEVTEELGENTFSIIEKNGSLVSPALREALRPALAIEPESRPQDVEAFRQLLLDAKHLITADDAATVLIKEPRPAKSAKSAAAAEPTGIEKTDVDRPARKKPVMWLTLSLTGLALAAILFFVFRPPAEDTGTGGATETEVATEQPVESREQLAAKQVDASDISEESDDITPTEKVSKYQEHRQAGDRLFEEKQFEAALAAYELALAEKPNDSHVSDRIKECEHAIEEAKAAEREARYAKTKAEGDRLFKQGKPEAARAKYQAAIKLKPDDPYLERQIDNCTSMAFIPGGAFLMGAKESVDERLHMVVLDAFYIDKHEVTVKEYQEFLEETGSARPPQWQRQLQNPEHPVVFVTWADANAFAEWQGKRLPTEAEWEYAARGGLENKIYPWGNEPPESKSEFDERFSLDRRGKLRPVGKYAANGYGLYDMADNAWEWCADWFQVDYYQTSPDQNPQGPESGSRRVVRGIAASEAFAAYNFRCHARFAEVPTERTPFIGFRCVMDVE